MILTGKNLSEDDRKRGQEKVSEDRQRGLKKTHEEIPKRPEHLEYIGMIDEFISDEFETLGIEKKEELLPEQVHFMQEHAFLLKFKENLGGVHQAFSDGIYINNGMLFKYYQECYQAIVCEKMLHEAIHKFSFKRYHLNIDEELNHNHFSAERYGYTVQNPHENEHEHLVGFNEAVIEKLTLEIIDNNRGKISKLFGIPEKEWEIMEIAYQSQMKVLECVISGVAAHYNEDKDVFWEEIKKGLFTGRLSHLKKIEECFGKGSLRVMGAMDCGVKVARRGTQPIKALLFRERTNNKILEYFNTTDEVSRSRIAQEILNERERLKYMRAKE